MLLLSLSLRTYKFRGEPILIFSSLITKICKREKVEKYQEDNWIAPNTPIYPLNMCSKGVATKSKKKKN